MNILQNIQNANGFEIAFLGIVIVFLCLFSLSVAVNLFHKIIFFLDNRHTFIQKIKKQAKINLSEESDFVDMVKQFMLFVEKYDEIPLPKFLRNARKMGLTSFYPVVAKMADEGYLVSNDRGFFVLNKTKCNELIGNN